jgi:hypothetical protein
MNAADRLLLKHGFNLDGSKKSKKHPTSVKRQIKTQILISSKKEYYKLRRKQEFIYDKEK